MAGLCAAAMVGSMVVPVWASDDAAEEEADGDVADVTEALVGLWKDSAGDIYGFYNDYSFFGGCLCSCFRRRLHSTGNAARK